MGVRSSTPEPGPGAGQNSRQHAVASGIWVAASRYIPLFGTAILSVAIGRVLGPDTLGTNSYIAYVQAIFAAAVMGVITTLAIRLMSTARGANDEAAFARISRLSQRAHVTAGLVSASALILIGWSTPERTLWLIAGLISLSDGIAWGFGATVVARRGWGASAKRRMMTQSVAVVLGLLSIPAGLGLTGVFAGALVASLMLLIVFRMERGPATRGTVHPLPSGLWVLSLSFGTVALLDQIVGGRVEILFLERSSTTDQISMYSIGFMVVSLAMILPVSMLTAALPAVAVALGQNRLEQARSSLGHAARVAFTLAVPLTFATAALGPLAVIVVYGSAFAEAAQLIPLMSMGILVGVVGHLCARFWTGANLMRIPIIAGVIGSAVDLAVAAAMIPRLDALGAAIANLSGTAAFAATTILLTRARVGPLGLMSRTWLLSTLVCGAAAIVTWTLLFQVWTSPVTIQLAALIAGVVGLALVGAVVGRTVGFIPTADREWLVSAVPSRLSRLAALLMPST